MGRHPVAIALHLPLRAGPGPVLPELLAVIDRTGATAPDSAGIYLILLRRLHFDDLPSEGIINVKGKVIGKTRDRTLDFLRDAKKSSEQAYTSQRPGPR